MGSDAPAQLSALGNLDVLALPKTALFYSVRCPGHAILTTYDQAAKWRDAGRRVISGFHSPVEKECLRILLAGFEDEKARLIDMMRVRLAYGDPIAVLFRMQRQVHGFAKGLAEAGIEVSVQSRSEPIRFSNPLPKLMTYHQGKGLTFDSVLLPRLDQASFQGAMKARLQNLLFVGVSRAISGCL